MFEEAQKRPVLLIGIKAAPHVNGASVVLFDVGDVEPDAERGKRSKSQRRMRRHSARRALALGQDHDECDHRDKQAKGCQHGVSDRIRVAAADRRRRLERHDVGGQYGLSLERGYEVVCHAGDEACEKKRDHGRFAALSEEVHDGEEGPCDAEAEDDELRPHAAQRRVVGDFHEEEARGYAEGGRYGFRVGNLPFEAGAEGFAPYDGEDEAAEKCHAENDQR